MKITKSPPILRGPLLAERYQMETQHQPAPPKPVASPGKPSPKLAEVGRPIPGT